jgi:ABC-type transporter Mla subunit MlaD
MMEVALIVVLIASTVAFGALVIWGIRLLRRLEDVAKDASSALRSSHELISALMSELPTLVRSLEGMSTQATRTLENADEKLTVLGESLEQFRAVSKRINTLEQRIQEKIEGPLMDAAKVIAGITSAIKTFANAFNRKETQ